MGLRIIEGHEAGRTLEDGRQFPQWNGETLSWDIGASFTLADEREGYPRTKAIIAAFREHRPEQLERERRELLKSALGDRVLGHNARKLLGLIEGETPDHEGPLTAPDAWAGGFAKNH